MHMAPQRSCMINFNYGTTTTLNNDARLPDEELWARRQKQKAWAAYKRELVESIVRSGPRSRVNELRYYPSPGPPRRRH